jgi:integrase
MQSMTKLFNQGKEKKLPVFFTEATFTKLLQHTISMKHKVAFLIGFQSGLRISEVLNLQKDDFDFKTNQIKVRLGKGSKDRMVPLPRDWQEHLINYIPIGIGSRTLQTAIEGAIRRAGLDKALHFHSLRHGYATHLIEEKGQPLHKVSQSMGHVDVSTTMVYTHINPEKRNKELRGAF